MTPEAKAHSRINMLLGDRQPVGVIEAKRDEAGEHITTVESQIARYAVVNRRSPSKVRS